MLCRFGRLCRRFRSLRRFARRGRWFGPGDRRTNR
jgi:hypothetical protein